MTRSFIIKGDICFSKNSTQLETLDNSYLVCVDGISKGVFANIPKEYENLEVIDYSNKLIIPGLIDLHVHGPQYPFRGLGMDLELIDWLNTYTFAHESKYEDVDYAKKAYKKFVEDLKNSSTTRAVIFASLHVPATIALMDLLEESKLVSYVGKVNMDRNGIEKLQEESAEKSYQDTKAWLEEVLGKYKNTYPILTPRFIPSCSDELMRKLSSLQKEYDLSVQSHLSENQKEIEWVSQLCPNTEFYGQAYDQFEMFGNSSKTIMAHCVWSEKKERDLIKERGVFIAHCPNSNMNLASGIAPVRKYLDENQNIGLGSDVAGGIHLSIFKQISDAIQVSKLYWRLIDQSAKPLTVEEGFYLASLSAGKFFGKVGSFESGYEFDALVIDDSSYTSKDLNIHQRLEKTIYISQDDHIVHKYVKGEKLF